MTPSHQQVAESIVDQFRASLSESTRQHIDSEQFARLASLIRGALAAEQTVAVEMVEDLLSGLRSRVEPPQLEL